jgi:hypothetical protein
MKTESHRATIVLHVNDVALDPEFLGEMVDDGGDAVERVGERFRIRRIAMAEAGIIGRHQVIVT